MMYLLLVRLLSLGVDPVNPASTGCGDWLRAAQVQQGSAGVSAI